MGVPKMKNGTPVKFILLRITWVYLKVDAIERPLRIGQLQSI